MTLRVELTETAKKELARLPKPDQTRIGSAVNALAQDPRPPRCLKVAGVVGCWRIRIGHYRAVYEIHEERLLVLVIRIGHRRDVYRNL